MKNLSEISVLLIQKMFQYVVPFESDNITFFSKKEANYDLYSIS